MADEEEAVTATVPSEATEVNRRTVARPFSSRTFDLVTLIILGSSPSRLVVVTGLLISLADDAATNPVHREFGRKFCRKDRRVPCGLASKLL